MAGEFSPRETQAERTRLAWRRTSLSLIAISLLCAAVVVHRGGSLVAVALLVPVLAAAAAGMAVAERRLSELSRPFRRVRRGPAGLALVIVIIGSIAIALIVTTAQ
jgi:uncharacterized membrane protein YidH (DUF202 family)